MRFARVLILLTAVLVVAAEWLSARPTATQDLTGLLNKFMAAAGRGDRAVFDKFFADDVIYTRATGMVITKADIMASLDKGAASAEPKEKTTYSAEDVTVHEYGETAIVAFRLVGRTEQTGGKAVTAHYRNTGTFLRRNGRWQAVAWQATKISDSGTRPQ